MPLMHDQHRDKIMEKVAASQGESVTYVGTRGVRQKSYLNKVSTGTKTTRILNSIEWVARHIEEKYLEKDISMLTSWQRTQLYMNMQEFLRPKLQRVVQQNVDEKPKRHTVLMKATSVKTQQQLPGGINPDAVQYIGKDGKPVAKLQANVLEANDGEKDLMITQIKTESHQQTVLTEIDENTGAVSHNISTVQLVPDYLEQAIEEDGIVISEVVDEP